MEPIRILTTEQMRRIDEAARLILEKTGMMVESSEALDYLDRFGCRVERDTGRVRMPRELAG